MLLLWIKTSDTDEPWIHPYPCVFIASIMTPPAFAEYEAECKEILAFINCSSCGNISSYFGYDCSGIKLRINR